MAIKLDLGKKDKETVNSRFAKQGKLACYMCNSILKNPQEIEYHFIYPTMENKLNDIGNIAPLCKKHKARLKDLSIEEFRALEEMEDFFSRKKAPKLNDVFETKIGANQYGRPVGIRFNKPERTMTITLESEELTLPVSVCPSTGYHYFYIVLPAQYINNDQELQPRPLEMKRMWELYRHLMLHSQLTPSVCRLADSRIMLFDGQHKTAAQVWAKRNEIECKVYIDPQIVVLKETNLIAHDKLRQMPFFSSVLINKWADLFSEQWQEYMHLPGEKSEADFVSFLVRKGRKKTEALNMITSNIYDSILEDEDNNFLKYISEYSHENGLLTLGKLKQNVFKKFICKPPLYLNIEDSDRLREHERTNVVKLLNKLAGQTANKETETVANIYLNGALKAWSTLLKETISQILGLYDDIDRKKILLREINKEEWNIIGHKIERLFGHRIWSDNSNRTRENLKTGKESKTLDFLKSRGLSVNWVLSDSGYRVNINNFID